jgi:signal transduction histidine kinase
MSRTVVHIADIRTDPEFSVSALQTREGYRTVLSVPMLRADVVVGVINLWRRDVRPFSDAQIHLVEIFADQAVIAIENVRLFTELQEKNRELTQAHAQVSEALEQQTATGGILRVISGSPTDVQPVFDTILDSATRLCAAENGILFQYDDGAFHTVACRGLSPEAETAFREQPARPGLHSGLGRMLAEKRPVQVADITDDIAYRQGDPLRARTVTLLGARTAMWLPLLKSDAVVGALSIYRRDVRPFTAKQIDLVGTFADQAVIAIENVRLFRELEARTTALTRSVEQLTALGEVGRAVSSTLDLGTVLTTIVSRAVQLSGLDGGVVFEYDENTEEFVQRVATETGGALAQARRTTRIRKGEGVLGQTAITLEPFQVPDITVPGAYAGRLRENLIESGVRAILAVPMVREGQLIGCLGVTRNRSGDFSVETIDLLRTFATQSALAIQNARLFHEIEDKSRQLEAASRHKSEFLANMSHELRTPLNAIIGFSEVLIQRMFGELNAKQDEYLKDVYASGQHLLSLINDILDLSKIEAGRMELHITAFEPGATLDGTVMLVKERAASRGITVSLQVDENLDRWVGDERKIRQVMLNLLSNSVKFTPEGGRIDVRAKRDGSEMVVAVSDTGIGIKPEDQARIFEEFQQAGSDYTKKAEGTGLGLALSRKFVELHGGTLKVESAEGQGSTFTFTLPEMQGVTA